MMISATIMNRILTISAIAMFAVVMSVSAFAPAMATKPDSNGDHKVVICHYQEAETIDNGPDLPPTEIPEAYVVINIDKAGKMNGHFKNDVAHHFPVDENDVQNGQGDFVITNDDEVGNPTEENDSVTDCEALDAALGA
jgi:hypothetical protein